MIRPPSIVPFVLWGAVAISGCEPTDVIEDLGTLGGFSSIGLGINQAGNVTGSSYLSSGDPHFAGMHAFRYVDGLGMIDLGALPPGNISQGNGINGGGLVCGMTIVEGAVAHAVFVNAILTMTDIGTLGGEFSYAWDINDQGVITGEASTAVEEVHAFRWTSAGMIDLGTLGGPRSVGRSINEAGQIAGESQTQNGGTRAFRFTEGVGMVDLGTLGGSKSSAYGINDAGQVVGESDTGFVIVTEPIVQGFTLFGTHAFLWTEGSGMTDLDHLGGGDSRAEAVNNHGVVVGVSELPNGTSHAFRWTSSEGMIDLNTLLPSGSGWVLISAYDINDKGQITGDGRLNGQERAFRLNPQPDSVN
jgi:probable HAF family extracellular repeat protein